MERNQYKISLETRASIASTVLSNDNDNTTTNPILLTSLTIILLLWLKLPKTTKKNVYKYFSEYLKNECDITIEHILS